MIFVFRDMTVEAITDGLYVAPGVETADYHASLNKNSWFYVFDYQARYGSYPQVFVLFISYILCVISGMPANNK